LFQKVTEPGSSYNEVQRAFTIRDLIKTTRIDMLTYRGSLTTPNCDETVTWMLSTTPMKISSSELAEFRQLKNREGMKILKNFRPQQELNGRRVLVF